MTDPVGFYLTKMGIALSQADSGWTGVQNLSGMGICTVIFVLDQFGSCAKNQELGLTSTSERLEE